MDWMKINLNDTVKVRLTQSAKDAHKKAHEDLWSGYDIKYHAHQEDENGYSEHQLWCLIQDFGPYINLGSLSPFEDNVILVREYV